MYLRGVALIAFSAACLGASGLAYKHKQQLDMSYALNNSVGKLVDQCRATRIETPFGVLGCVETVSGQMPGRP